MSEVKFIMMMGLPGSGKSTIAKDLAVKYNATILSSDEYRKKLLGDENCQSDNQRVFSTLYADMRNLLSEGKSVIYDATNMSMKDRGFALSNTVKYKCERIVYFVNEAVGVCKERNSNRERVVPSFVYDKMLSKFSYPQKFEGFDKVILHIDKDSDSGMEYHSEYEKDVSRDVVKEFVLMSMNAFEQKSKWHKYNLGEHCVRVAEAFPTFDNRYEAGILHDVGKLFTQTIDEEGFAHYYGHAGAGAYFIASHPWFIRGEYNFDEVMFYISEHMHIRDIIGSENAVSKYKNIFGEGRFNSLVEFMEADNKACK